MSTIPRFNICLAVAAVAASTAAPAYAASVAALVDGTSIAVVDTAAMKAVSMVKLDGGASLVGIDVRPADKQLYGLTASGDVVTIDWKTGKWSKKSSLSEKLPAGAMFAVDFNPAADRLRVIGSEGTSLRINVEDGKTIVDGSLKFADADAMKGQTAKVAAAAYTNSVAGTKETALYDIDWNSGALLKQAPPNDGILNTVGKLGVKLDGAAAFDIATDAQGKNWAWLMAGKTLHAVDLTTGAAKAAGDVAGVTGKVQDIAVLPVM